MIVPSLEAAGILAFVDVFVLTDACVTWARICQVERKMSEDGLVVESGVPGRGLVRHPLATVANQYRTNLRALVAELGLSPSARGRLDVAVPAGAGAGEHRTPAAADAAELLD